MTEFVAIDGEGYTDDTGHHIYNLLGASDGTYLHNDLGLSTRGVFSYLLNLAESNRGKTFVSFVFSYDVDKMLSGLSVQSLDKLAHKGFVYLRDRHSENAWVYVAYLPRKWFELAEVSKRTVLQPDGSRKTKMVRCGRCIRVYDTFGFFQTSFLKALETFKIGTDFQRDFIETMKFQRHEFTAAGLELIRKYNLLECRLLVDLMETVDRCLREVDIKLSSWHGAGAVAGHVLKREKVRKHFYRPTNEVTQHEILSAYFGGRVQATRIGRFETTYGYDIISAYPSAMSNLCSLSGAREIYTDTFIDAYPYAVYDVEWAIPISAPLTCLPFRNRDGTIEYPYSGRARLWAPEIQAAMEVYGPEHFTIHSGLVFDNLDTRTRPFDFIPTLFKFRQELKNRGSMAQICLKLALNSLYGKLAQGVGYRGQVPSYQCYIYAGLITSMTRASLTRATANSPHVISLATDGILSTEPLSVNVGTDLGQWEAAVYDCSFVLKPGIYRLERTKTYDGIGPPERKILTRVRGFPTKHMIEKWPDLESIWDEQGVAGKAELFYDRFISMKAASDNFHQGEWYNVRKEISFLPARGVPIQTCAHPLQFRVIPEYVRDGMSMAYKKATDPQDGSLDDFFAGYLD